MLELEIIRIYHTHADAAGLLAANFDHKRKSFTIPKGMNKRTSPSFSFSFSFS